MVLKSSTHLDRGVKQMTLLQTVTVTEMLLLNPTMSLQATATTTTESGVDKTKLSLIIGKIIPKSRTKPSSGSVGGQKSSKKSNAFKKSSFGFNGRNSESFKQLLTNVDISDVE